MKQVMMLSVLVAVIGLMAVMSAEAGIPFLRCHPQETECNLGAGFGLPENECQHKRLPECDGWALYCDGVEPLAFKCVYDHTNSKPCEPAGDFVCGQNAIYSCIPQYDKDVGEWRCWKHLGMKHPGDCEVKEC